MAIPREENTSEWDNEANGEQPIAVAEESHFGSASLIASGSYTDAGWAHAPLYYTTSTNLATATISNTSTFGSIEIDSNSIEYRTPLSFDCHKESWGYVIAFSLSLLFSPLLVIWSKIMGRSAGIRIRV